MSTMFYKDEVNPWAYWDKVFTPAECKKIIDIATKKGKIDAEIGNKADGIIDKNIRNNKIVWLHETDIPWVYETIAPKIISLNERFFRFDLDGIIEQMQFTEYNAPDNNYVAHVDRAMNMLPRKLSISIQLTNPKKYEGGELELINSHNPEVMKKDQGYMVAFPSFTLHKVNPVTKGTRHSLVIWVSGKQFK